MKSALRLRAIPVCDALEATPRLRRRRTETHKKALVCGAVRSRQRSSWLVRRPVAGAEWVSVHGGAPLGMRGRSFSNPARDSRWTLHHV